MAKNLYIMSSSLGIGKSSISLSIATTLKEYFKHLAYFRPIKTNNSIISKLEQGVNFDDINDITTQENALNKIIQKYKQLEANNDFVLIEGLDYIDQNTEFGLNLLIAKNLSSQIILVAKGSYSSSFEIIRRIKNTLNLIKDSQIDVVGIIVNRVAHNLELELKNNLKLEFTDIWYAVILENEKFARPSVDEIAKKINAEIFSGHKYLQQQVKNYTIAAKPVNGFLNSESNKDGLVVITPGDRDDLILSCLSANQSIHFAKIACLLLTTGVKPTGIIEKIILSIPSSFPILLSQKNSFEVATELNNAKYNIHDSSNKKIELIVDYIRNHFHEKSLIEKLTQTTSSLLTPHMFSYNLIQKAKKIKKHIVLPEGSDVRVLAAAEELLINDIVDITVLGNENEINRLIKQNNLKLDKLNIINPAKSANFDEYATKYYELRKHKNVNMTIAQDRMQNVNYYGTMMVYFNHCDGMVSGAIHTTGETIKPTLEIIKTSPGNNLISSIFLMCLANRVLVYGDCAVNPDPNDNDLAEIAYSSALSAQDFGIEPIVAMLSYSSGDSGQGVSVDKVRRATTIMQNIHPEILVEGPIQYDAAVNIAVGQKKLPQSKVAGLANVLIFPDLNTGNNTYKAVQRETNAIAIGPILQGLNKPVNDLSRGCTVKDIVNTIIITAIQAQRKNT